MMEYADLIEDKCTLDGVSGRFVMSKSDGSHEEIPFHFNGRSRTLEYAARPELASFQTAFYADAKEAWLSHRDTVRDLDVQTVKPWCYVPGLATCRS